MKKQIDKKWIRNKSDEQAVLDGCYFDQSAVDYVLSFFNLFLKQSKGQWGGQPFKLLDWQIDLISQIYGWKTAKGFRRFRSVYVEIPKKNGKTTLVAGLALYHLIADGENGAECYICACDRNQAGMLYDETLAMVKQSDSLSELLKPIPSKKTIEFPAMLSKLVALSKEAGSQEGKNASFVVIDELHRQKTPDLFQTMRYAGRARQQPLFISITTAGSNRQSVCWEQHEFARKVINGEIVDTTFLPVIFAASPSDNLKDPKTWKKANPSLGVTIDEGDFAKELNQAEQSKISWNSFLRYSFNIWTSSDFRFINRDKWDLCAATFNQELLRGKRCWLGCDLSSTKDFSSAVILFESTEIIPFFWIPESQLDTNPSYRNWQSEGWLVATPGEVIDYDYIQKEIEGLSKQYNFEALFLDPYNATQLANKLQSVCNIEFYRQGILSMNGPTKEMERLILTKELKHNGNPVLSWMAENSVCYLDNQGNAKIIKENAESKIDGMIALAMAIAARTAAFS